MRQLAHGDVGVRRNKPNYVSERQGLLSDTDGNYIYGGGVRIAEGISRCVSLWHRIDHFCFVFRGSAVSPAAKSDAGTRVLFYDWLSEPLRCRLCPGGALQVINLEVSALRQGPECAVGKTVLNKLVAWSFTVYE